ncbi:MULTISPECIES: hypothetical protein [Nocardiopsidaceae]|uniref:Uncharacterized protein n=3 Tax=Nocardiopsidaceae TaxID=83676 RepID=A0A840WB89_9ACTN|nr:MULTISPECIES: hypothetical protein [Nocardiopsaceae]MBB5493392.1 hypothetical protein [Nocardiopsis metallicus]MEE2051606.1 hypothetical protein [Nocardiopsis umidischolae]PSK87508.1 hypothetical protein CLV63_13161 [Murinocardiopsis flavida]
MIATAQPCSDTHAALATRHAEQRAPVPALADDVDTDEPRAFARRSPTT